MFLDANWVIPNRLAIGAMPHSVNIVWNHGFDYLLVMAAEHSWAKETGPHRAWVDVIPLYDEPKLTIKEKDKLSRASKRVVKLLKNGFKVLITCNAGLNRSGLMTAMVVRELYKVNGLVASRLIQRARRGTLQNTTYRQYVEGLSTL